MHKKIIILAGLFILASGCQTSLLNQTNKIAPIVSSSSSQTIQKTEEPIAQPVFNGAKPASSTSAKPANSLVVPKSLVLPVAFAAQAPLGDWQPLYNEACEEASMIMAVKYLNGQSLTKEIMNQEIIDLVNWEERNGYGVDVSAEQTVKILADYFKVKARVVKIVNVDLIKSTLASGHLIIAPAAGQQLGNPNFRRPGPLYHMLIIRGYDENYFITNDPGTRKGEGYKYKIDVLLKAIHDWNDGEVTLGDKVMIVLN